MQFQKIFFYLNLLFSSLLFSHPLPNTVVNLNVQSKNIIMTIQIPLEDFEIAYKSKVTENQNLLLANYFSKHIKIEGANHQFWKMKFNNYQIKKANAAFVGDYKEIQFELQFSTSKNANYRDFTIHYDAIMHEITNHQALVFVNADWENGIHEQAQQIGIIELDVPTNTIYPLHISLEKGSTWKGFKSMITLGMKHISEGTDHLLFLLVLLLSAPLISINKKWVYNGKIKYTIVKILKIITAFTIGHSITLIIGTLTTFNPNSKPVEILIAFSILITAIHALKPIFPNKEIYVACGFGLIHGMAFATILKELHLTTSKLTLSLLGFNLGIEIMQLITIILVMPWLIILSKFKIYKWVRITGALFAIIASIAWLVERYTEKPNFISVPIQNSANYSIWVVLGLACFTFTFLIINKIIKIGVVIKKEEK